MSKRDNSTPERRFSNNRASVRGKGTEWALTLDQYKEITKHNRCYYCRKDLGALTGSCLDRLDPKDEGGYHVDNVLPCCGECNTRKSDKLTESETKFLTLSLKLFRRYRD